MWVHVRFVSFGWRASGGSLRGGIGTAKRTTTRIKKGLQVRVWWGCWRRKRTNRSNSRLRKAAALWNALQCVRKRLEEKRFVLRRALRCKERDQTRCTTRNTRAERHKNASGPHGSPGRPIGSHQQAEPATQNEIHADRGPAGRRRTARLL